MSETITIYCKNNNTYKDVPIGSSLLDIYTAVGAPLRYRPMNAQVNNKTESLNFRCWQPKDIEFIDYTIRIENLCPLALPYIFQGGV